MLLAAAAETAQNLPVWAVIVIASFPVLGTAIPSWFAYKANQSAKASRAQTAELAESAKTNRTSGGSLGVSLDQVHDKLDGVAKEQRLARKTMGSIVGEMREIKQWQGDHDRRHDEMVDPVPTHIEIQAQIEGLHTD